MPNGPGFVHVSEDPERDWQRIGPHALYDAQTYAAWQTPDQRSQMHVEAQTIDDMKRSAAYKVLTPDECVAARARDRPRHPAPADGRPGAGAGVGEPAAVRTRGAAEDKSVTSDR